MIIVRFFPPALLLLYLDDCFGINVTRESVFLRVLEAWNSAINAHLASLISTTDHVSFCNWNYQALKNLKNFIWTAQVPSTAVQPSSWSLTTSSLLLTPKFSTQVSIFHHGKSSLKRRRKMRDRFYDATALFKHSIQASFYTLRFLILQTLLMSQD